jgi:hypothetical protein
LQVSLSETCTHLVQATYVASDWGIVHARTHHHTPPKKSHNTQPLLCHPTMANAPPRQALGTNGKDLLQRRWRLPGRSGVVVAAPEAPGTSVSVNVLPSPLPDWRWQPEERRSNASHRRGDRGIAAAVKAALAQLSCLSKRGARAGAALAVLYRRALAPHAGPRWRHERSRG